MNFPHSQKAPGGSPGTPLRGCSRPQRLFARRGFTLVELLAVIMIIAMLAALITPAVMRALASARNAAIKAEIDMLHMAIMNYKNEYGSFPPSYAPTLTGSDAACRHLSRLFPRIATSNLLLQAQSLPYMNSGTAFPAAGSISPDTSIVGWLHGYNSVPTNPVLFTTGSVTLASGTISVSGAIESRKKTYDFDSSRINNYRYFPSSKPNSPYVYIDRSWYGTVGVSGSIPTFNIVTASGTQVYFALRQPTAAAPTAFNNVAQQPFNPDSFQILCAGRDEEFGTEDDLSNFWPGTRQDYEDSRRN